MEDVDLILRSRRGDEAAFAAIVGRYQTWVYHLLWRLLGDSEEAMDASQETFLRAYRALGQFDPARPLGPWLDRIATNIAYDVLRSRHRRPELGMDEEGLARLADRSREPEGRFLRQEAWEELNEAIAALPDEYRLVVIMRHLREMSYDEICQELGWPLSLVKNRLFRGRKLLKERLERAAEGGRRHAGVYMG